MIIVLATLISVIILLLLLAPFFVGDGGLLAPSAKIDSIPILESTKEMIIKRYLEEEKALEKGDLSAREWAKRREFLVHRYVDAARRLDFLKGQSGGSAA